MLSPQFSGRKNVTGRKWLQVRSSFGRGRPISCRFKVEEWTQEKRPSLFVLPLVRSAVPSSLKGHVRDSVASRLQLRSHHHCRRLCSPSAPQKSALLVRPAPTATSCSSFESFSGLADCTECQKKKATQPAGPSDSTAAGKFACDRIVCCAAPRNPRAWLSHFFCSLPAALFSERERGPRVAGYLFSPVFLACKSCC